MITSIYRCTYQLINQSTNQLLNQSTNHQSISKAIKQLTSQNQKGQNGWGKNVYFSSKNDTKNYHLPFFF